MDSDKIYVVTQGSYSDYHVVAVTMDHDIAEKIVAKFSNSWGECRIEEYGDAEAILKPAWYIYFDKDGNVCDTVECDSDYGYSRIGEVCEKKNNYYFGRNYHIYVVVSADDLDSAVKIAAEKRAQYLARKLGL